MVIALLFISVLSSPYSLLLTNTAQAQRFPQHPNFSKEEGPY